MYYPILRGRQNELIAIRELASLDKLDNVIPVIEPVKASSTLLKTLGELVERGKDCYVILNPAVGLFERELQLDSAYAERLRELMVKGCDVLHPCLHLIANMDEALQKYGPFCNVPAVFFDPNHQDEFAREFADASQLEAVFIGDSSRRHVRSANKILVEDRFNAKERNADYRACKDEFFSDDYLFYRHEGYCGFGDYSVVGKRYIVGGFRPKVVAIHCIYEKDGRALYVHHAVSGEEVYGDTATLYGNALEELLTWAGSAGLLNDPTEGMKQFLRSHNQGSFPGLGLVKKWSIMHHLELVSRMMPR